jgi:hypothetical protein
MTFQFNRRTVAFILSIVAVFLLAVNLLISLINPQVESQSGQNELSTFQIDSLFLFSINSFGLYKEWIKEVQNKKTNKSYIVRLPYDLSIPVVLAEINTNFFGKNLIFSSEEKDFSGRTRLTINRRNKTILSAELKYDREIFRPRRTVAFLIKDYELSSSEDSLFLELPEPFSVMLLPSVKNTKLLKYVTDLNKTYSIIIDDNIPDIKYRLNESYSQKRLKTSLQSIINDFSKASFFIINDRSDLYLSPSIEFVRLELEKRNINLVMLSKIHQLDYASETELKNSFDNYLKMIGEGEGVLFSVTSDDFRTLLPEIERYRKTGFKIVHPSETNFAADTLINN